MNLRQEQDVPQTSINTNLETCLEILFFFRCNQQRSTLWYLCWRFVFSLKYLKTSTFTLYLSSKFHISRSSLKRCTDILVDYADLIDLRNKHRYSNFKIQISVIENIIEYMRIFDNLKCQKISHVLDNIRI